MSLPMAKELLAPLKIFVDLCAINPAILNLPDLAFFKEFIEKLGGRIPGDEIPSTKVPTEPKINEPDEPLEEDSANEDNSEDLELDITGVIGKFRKFMRIHI